MEAIFNSSIYNYKNLNAMNPNNLLCTLLLCTILLCPLVLASNNHLALSIRYCTICVFCTRLNWINACCSWALKAESSDEEGVEAVIRIRLGAQTMARFLEVMPVSEDFKDSRCKWWVRCSRVLKVEIRQGYLAKYIVMYSIWFIYEYNTVSYNSISKVYVV